MTILFRYLLREYAKIFAMCFASLMTLYLVIDFFEKIRRFLRLDAEVADVLFFFLLRMPGISFQIAPLAVLMATLLTLGMLSRNREITAMRSCGISLFTLAGPFLVFGVAVAIILLAFSSTVIPLANGKADEVRLTRIEKKPPQAALRTPHPWTRIGPRTLMNVQSVDAGGETLRGVRLFHLDEDSRLDWMTEAQQAQHVDGHWTLRDGMQRLFLADGTVQLTTFPERRIDLSLIPDDFTTWLSVESDMMTFRELRAYVQRLRYEGASATRYQTDYYGRVAFPFVTVIMVLVGIAMSLQGRDRRGSGMAIGIGQAMVLGFCYWAVHSVNIALGRSGVFHPLLAGWMANLMFLALGGYLLLKLRY